MSGGGKGDKQESKITLPPEVQALATRNLQAAEKAGKIGYVPYQGPTVAALNPMQINSMQQNANAMQAFGMAPANVMASIPKPKTYAGGLQGYDPLALYTQAIGKIAPSQQKQIISPTFVKDGKAMGLGGVPTARAKAKVAAAVAAPRNTAATKQQAKAVAALAKMAAGGAVRRSGFETVHSVPSKKARIAVIRARNAMLSPAQRKLNARRSLGGK